MSKLHGEERTPIVTLCGSSRYKGYFEEMSQIFNIAGYIVLKPDFFMKSVVRDANADLIRVGKVGNLTLEEFMHQCYVVFSNKCIGYHLPVNFEEKDFKQHLKELQYNKIAISDMVFVIDPDGYIGQDTKDEIEYAKELGVEIRYMREVLVVGDSDV